MQTNQKNNSFLSYYSTYFPTLFLDCAIEINENDKLWDFLNVIAKVDLDYYIKIIDSTHETDARGRKGFSTKDTITAILFAYTINVRSTRKIEDLINNDIRFIYIMNHQKPCHVTISNVINDYLLPNINDIFRDINIALFDLDPNNINFDDIYIDGTKFESVGNKYQFVWKKACITFKNKMKLLIDKYINEINEQYFDEHMISISKQDDYSPELLESIIGLINDRMIKDFVIPVKRDKGVRVPFLQKVRDVFLRFYKRTTDYLDKIAVCGDKRNSYCKTDKDATFMRMKTDYMGNTSLLPAYNVQVTAAGQYVLDIKAYSYVSDTSAFVEIIESFKVLYGKYPDSVTGDAGYGSLYNYTYLDYLNIKAYIKYASFHRENNPTAESKIKSKLLFKNFYKLSDETTEYEGDKKAIFICPNNKRVEFDSYGSVEGYDYDRKTEIYKCIDCRGCIFKGSNKAYEETCYKSDNAKSNKTFNVNLELTEYHERATKLLNSEEGYNKRAKRAALVEGIFGDIKSNYGFERFTRTGIEKVDMEIKLVAIGHNIRAYHNIMNIRKKGIERKEVISTKNKTLVS